MPMLLQLQINSMPPEIAWIAALFGALLFGGMSVYILWRDFLCP